MGHDRLVGRGIERQPPTGFAFFFRIVPGPIGVRLGQSGKHCGVFGMVVPAIGGVLHVLIEVGLHHGKLLHQVPELRLFLLGEGNTGKSKVSQCMVDESTLRFRCVVGK